MHVGGSCECVSAGGSCECVHVSAGGSCECVCAGSSECMYNLELYKSIYGLGPRMLFLAGSFIPWRKLQELHGSGGWPFLQCTQRSSVSLRELYKAALLTRNRHMFPKQRAYAISQTTSAPQKVCQAGQALLTDYETSQHSYY